MKLDLLRPTFNLVLKNFSGAIALAILAPQFTSSRIVNAQAVNPQPRLNSVPTIDWRDRLTSFEQDEFNPNQVYSFNCLAAPNHQIRTPVWGTGAYTINSGLCRAAVHQGMITNQGGLINIQLLTANNDYQGSDRFGVSSLDYSRSSAGFEFIGNPIAFENDNEQDPNERRQPSQIERTVGNGVRRGIERTISDSIRDIFR